MSSSLDRLLPGARVAVSQCLAIGPQDRVFIITDKATWDIGEALSKAAQEKEALVHLRPLEDFGTRPFTSLPGTLAQALREFQPTATFFAAQGQPGEVAFRLELGRLLRNELRVRHGHMIGITPELMRTGMQADYFQVARRTQAIFERVRNAQIIRVTNPDGTDFTVTLDPTNRRWIPCTGLYHQPGQWGNLPEGEVFTAPLNAQGTLTANLLGDYFSEKYGLLEHPMTFVIQDGRVVRIEHPHRDLAQEVWTYLQSDENGSRVGEFAIGTNEFLTQLTGNLLQDEKFPGVHVAFGDPYADRTGADWHSRVHVDVIPLRVNVWVDGEPLMRDGRFVV